MTISPHSASGRSSALEDTARLTMAQFVEDLEGLRVALGLDQLNLLGHSFGGLLAMYYAAEYPEAVNKLVLVDSSPASWRLNFPHFRRAIAERQTELDREEMARLVSTPDARSDPTIMDRYYKLFFRAFFNASDLPARREAIPRSSEARFCLTGRRTRGCTTRHRRDRFKEAILAVLRNRVASPWWVGPEPQSQIYSRSPSRAGSTRATRSGA